MNKIYLPLGLILGIFCYTFSAEGNNRGLEDPYSVTNLSVADTIPPPAERFGDFLHDQPTNPFDLKDPSVVEQNVEFDPVTGNYIITEKVGDDYFRAPSYMTFDEYLEYQRKQEEKNYFNQLAGINTGENGLSSLDPISKIDVKNSLLDRLFGGTKVDIRPQGNIDLTFGVDYQRLDNPILTERQRSNANFDFDMNIQMNVTGKIGEKLNLTTNYNTNATFNFDNVIKLDYNSDLYGEDDILKRIEAGNVSLPLRGTLIQGAQSLFGLKTELQFGHLRLTAVASQQRSQRENIRLEGGSQKQEFEVRADEYDENRHFFLSHYFRDNYEDALANLPNIRTLARVTDVEVWLTVNRNDVNVESIRDIVAFADLGEPEVLVNPGAVNAPTIPVNRDFQGKGLPANNSNDLYEKIINRPGLKDVDRVVSVLQSSEFGLVQGRDFEKVSARRLRSTEFTYNAELGFISLNVNVQPDQVVAVSFTYEYNGGPPYYAVGDGASNENDNNTDTTDLTPQVMFVKMLKSTAQPVNVPTWDLMMKNVYSIGAYQVEPQDFLLDIFYDDPGQGYKRFLPTSNLAGQPLLRVFNLDRLNTYGDPQPDGRFDFVPGTTINPANGRIYFPVLEPFGSSLAAKLDDEQSINKYVYQDLYDETLFNAIQTAEKNRFIIKGSYKSSVSSEISLGAFNIPEDSETVTAGGALLRRGQDYEIDYSTGRLRILNDAILASGVPINVSFEDNTLFGFQQKTMVGLRADYEVSKDINIGATFLQLYERPFTPKVNIGEDPINNKIYGLDLNLSKEAPWLTRAVDAIPFISTKAPSSINFSAEAAYLKPGHASAINESKRDKSGTVYIDDFEGAASSFDLRTPVNGINGWALASVPQNDDGNRNPLFPEATADNLAYGANRALLNWYRIDPSARGPRDCDLCDPYTSLVPQEEVFPNRQLTPEQLPNIQTLDLSFFPQERGPYNFDTPDGYPGLTRGVNLEEGKVTLKDGETRWGGIMRQMNTPDFQTANIEFLEFWMLSPFLDTTDARNPADNVLDRQGKLFINLGSVSEDILKDSRKFFENGLPTTENPNRRTDNTTWARVPVGQQITNSFDLGDEVREQQDVGLDGLSNQGEATKFADYLNAIRAENPTVADRVAMDPSNDDFYYYRDDQRYSADDGVRQRYQSFNNSEGNSRSNTGNSVRSSNSNFPDSEDINRDNTLNETEAYFQYEIPLEADPTDPREIDASKANFITDRIEDPRSGRIWYRFRIPLNGDKKTAVNGIRDFRSIRFMRMYLNGFRAPVTLRFASLEMVRNQWRRYIGSVESANGDVVDCDNDASIDIDAVNIEENSNRQPFNYTLPIGIQREQSLGVFSTQQNEKALALRVQGLCDGASQGVFKIIETDMRVYERFKMFIHAEQRGIQVPSEIPDGELSVFVRLGSDFKDNYYEYEIPLVMSDPNAVFGLDANSDQYKREVWKDENSFDFELAVLRKLKEERNNTNFDKGTEYSKIIDAENGTLPRSIKVKGNPNLGYVKVAFIGIRNSRNGSLEEYSAEIWANEMRLTGLDERGAAAALARMDVQLADLGNLSIAGNINSIGFGALNDGVQDRSREQVAGYDMALDLSLDKFLPEKWGIKLPFYGQISNVTKTPEYDPYDLDIKLKDKLSAIDNKADRDSVMEQAQERTNIRAFNFTDVRKERTGDAGGAKPTPWDIENFSVSYGYSETERSDPIISSEKEQLQKASIDYGFSRSAKYIEPFKGLKKNKYLRLIGEFNFNPLPNSFTVSSYMERRFITTSYRFTGLEERFRTYYAKYFKWDRDYNLQWDFSKALKFSFNALASSIIDEPDERRIRDDADIEDVNQYRRDSIWSNIKSLGRPKLYNHNVTANYTLPIRYLPYMEWVNIRAQYSAEYAWEAASLVVDSLGNVIRNSQNRQINADLNFEKLYDQFGYLKKINRPARKKPTRGRTTPDKDKKEDLSDSVKDKDKEKKKKDNEPSVFERALIRPLLLVRRARFNYTERFQTVVPGFTPRPSLLGMESGFGAPGLDFAAGLQPKIRELTDGQQYTSEDWLYQNREWITGSTFQNQKVIQNYTQSYDAKLTLEPFTDFKIDFELNKTFTEDYQESFKDTLIDNNRELVHLQGLVGGNMTVTYSALQTLFQSNTDQLENLFQTFQNNQVVISQRLGTRPHSDINLARRGFTDGYGENQQDVIIPAFIAAYTNQDASNIDMNLFNILPKVNWRVQYDGLSKLPFFREIFSNFTLSHAYRSTLTVGRYSSNARFYEALPRNGGLNNDGNFFARIEIPEVAIQEAFSPLIGVEATLQNGMSFNLDYKKSRGLSLSSISKLLSERTAKEITAGFGYLLRDVDIPFLTGSKKKGAKKKKDEPDPKTQNKTNNNRNGGRGGQLQGRDLDIQCNFSLRDDITLARDLTPQADSQPTRGNFALSFSPSVEYKLNKRLSLRLFFDYRKNIPRTSTGYPRTDASGGIVVRFELN